MRHLKSLVTALVVSLFLTTGCNDFSSDSVTPNATPPTKSLRTSAELSAEMKAKLDAFVSSLPATDQKRIKEISSHILGNHTEYRSMVLRATGAVEPTPCDASNTPLNLWLGDQLADWTSNSFYYADFVAMLDLPTYDALVFENSSANQYFGVNGEYSQILPKTFKDLKRFWNIQSSDIILAAMHGSMLQDRSKVIRTYKAVYGLGQADAEYYADFVLLLLDVFPEYRNGNHPIFTFNAFALEGFDYRPYAIVPDKIIMGDGIMEAYAGIGFGDIAPQAILAHEFGHHIQFQLDLFDEVDSPEGTRRTELMADAYAAYYLSHARGATMQWKRVKQFLQVFFNIGDCGFTRNGHHGTPTQRMAAAEWGYSVANNAKKQGHILPVEEFTARFEAQLPTLVKQ